MSALKRAFSFAKMDHMTMLIRQDLEFNVPCGCDKLFQVDVSIAKRSLRFAPGSMQEGRKLLGGDNLPHAFSAAAGGGFDEQGKADLRGDGDDLIVAQGALAFCAGNNGYPGCGNGGARNRFVAHCGNRAGARPDECQPGFFDFARKVIAFSQKAIPRMNGARSTASGDFDDCITAQIRVARRRRSKTIGFISIAHMQRFTIRLGIDGNRLHPQFMAGAQDTDCNFAPVRN